MKNLKLVRISAKTLPPKKSKSWPVREIGLSIKTLLFLLLCTFSLTAQNANKSWGLEAYYTPQYSNYLSSDFLQNDGFVPAYSNSIGLGFEKDIAKNWAINTGLVFQTIREGNTSTFEFHASNGISGLTLDNSAGPFGGIPETIDGGHELIEYFTIAIPITTKLFFQKGIFRWYCRTGPQPEIEYRNRRIFISNPNPSRPFDPLEEKVITNVNKVSLSWVLGFGMDVNVKNILSVFVEPEGKANLLRPEGVFDVRRYLAGLRVGVRGRFAKEL